MRTFDHNLSKSDSKLVVMLPGRGEDLGKLKERGLFDSFRSRGYDVIIADLHLGYYIEGSFIDRLREDVILPARNRGYMDIWLVGNSLGGNGALFYIKAHPDDINGVVLLGPYLGEEDVIKEIKASGGPDEWNPARVDDSDFDRILWMWLSDLPSDTPSIYLGYGTFDRFSKSHDLLSGILPPQRVAEVNGGHDWITWKKAWDVLIERDIGLLESP